LPPTLQLSWAPLKILSMLFSGTALGVFLYSVIVSGLMTAAPASHSRDLFQTMSRIILTSASVLADLVDIALYVALVPAVAALPGLVKLVRLGRMLCRQQA
jgi:hypothetical protein